MNIKYEVLPMDDISQVKDLCNELMSYQKSKSLIHTELFDDMCFETRLIPSIEKAKENYIVVAKDGADVVGYVYSNISNKETYDNEFATFFDMDSVQGTDVGCLSQFYLKEEYRGMKIGSKLFDMSVEWLNSFESVKDLFIFVSNGNDSALQFYKSKGFNISHEILDGFIKVLRNQ